MKSGSITVWVCYSCKLLLAKSWEQKKKKKKYKKKKSQRKGEREMAVVKMGLLER